MEINRRDFLKVTAAAGAVATVGLPRLNAFAASDGTKGGATAGEWMASTC
ncbi:MAG: twin-arginine translocation signal domain-containing protein, partial [Trichlorobacter sp.]